METKPTSSFLGRHEFLIRRLHSLSGLVPVGAYMVVHLLTNASIMDRPATFQRAVYQIHSLGRLLPLVEWTFIFLPLLFHAIIGVVIVRGGLPNHSTYAYRNNIRYTLQRATGMIAMGFIFWHVFHLHGWFHFEGWLENVAKPLGGARFRPYNAASSLASAMSGFVVPVLYLIGVLSCVYHLANGLWTMGITWGVWTSPTAQRRANWACTAFGIGLTVVSLTAIAGVKRVNLNQALDSEQRMFDAKLAGDEISAEDASHKRSTADELERLRESSGGNRTERAAAPAPSSNGT